VEPHCLATRWDTPRIGPAAVDRHPPLKYHLRGRSRRLGPVCKGRSVSHPSGQRRIAEIVLVGERSVCQGACLPAMGRSRALPTTLGHHGWTRTGTGGAAAHSEIGIPCKIRWGLCAPHLVLLQQLEVFLPHESQLADKFLYGTNDHVRWDTDRSVLAGSIPVAAAYLCWPSFACECPLRPGGSSPCWSGARATHM
jgi:hypothetical protein